MNLTPQQDALLKDLALNEVWRSLLRDIKEDPETKIRPWKPNEDDEERKHFKWVFESGISKGIDKILTILSLEGLATEEEL